MSRSLAAGIDLGGTKIYSLVARESGEVLGEDLALPILARRCAEYQEHDCKPTSPLRRSDRTASQAIVLTLRP